jgi:hypothetical protein
VGTPIPILVVNDTVLGTKSAAGATDIRVSWTDAPGPFNVYRGQRTSPLSWSYNQMCFASMTASPVADPAVPPSTTIYYYLVTRKTGCGESTLGEGRDSAGAPIPRPNGSPCP